MRKQKRDRVVRREPEKQMPVAEAPRRYWIAALLLLIATIGSLMMVLDHFGGMRLPGCGAGSACARASASRWGKVPGIDWPVSFVGAAFFLSMITAWITCRGRIGGVLRLSIVLGAAASIGFVVVSAAEKIFCVYCLIVHAANLAFTWMALGGDKRESGERMGHLAAAGVFVLVTAALGVGQVAGKAAVQKRAEADLAAATAKMVKKASEENATTSGSGAGKSDTKAGDSGAGVERRADEKPAPPPNGFTGRFRYGPEEAAIRVVMFTDYQCPDCALFETQLKQLMEAQPALDLAVIIKSFPFSTSCNPNAPSNMHPNACWAARAAITAGFLQGSDGFWRMHHWLFSRRGSFTDAELNSALPGLGFEVREFNALMQNETTLIPVQEDIKEAMSLGIYQTPMIFVNGEELKGWNAPQSLVRAVQALAAANPPKKSFAFDVPRGAAEKFLAAWRDTAPVVIPSEVRRHTVGPSDAKVDVVVFGDYQEVNTVNADSIIRLFTKGPEASVRYTFAHFPVSKQCNPVTQLEKHPMACLAARAAEGSELVGGEEGFWKMHEWLTTNRARLSEATLAEAAGVVGVELSMLRDAMSQPLVGERIVGDCRAAEKRGIKSIPFILVNGKLVERWMAGNENILPRVFREAGGG